MTKKYTFAVSSSFDSEARQFMGTVRNTEKAYICPCCSRLVKVYRRTIHAEVARFLILLVERYQKYPRYYSMRELYPHQTKSCSDGVYLVHWDLIEKSDGTNTALAPAGTYKPTDKGMRFVYGLERVPSHVHLLQKEILRWSDKTIDIKDALGKKFDYPELMQNCSTRYSKIKSPKI
jgi:hypothetical protein